MPDVSSFSSMNGVMEWKLNGKLHRKDGPAFINDNIPEKAWLQHGELHRMGGPAIIGPEGEFWYQRGHFHRLGGPAVTLKDGTKKWFLFGVFFKEELPKKEKTNWKREGF